MNPTLGNLKSWILLLINKHQIYKIRKIVWLVYNVKVDKSMLIKIKLFLNLKSRLRKTVNIKYNPAAE